MSGFADFFDVAYAPLTNKNLLAFQAPDAHVVGSTLWVNYMVRDGNNAAVALDSGYTASMTCKVDGVLLATFTNTLTSGRQILLQSAAADDQIILTATPSASTTLFDPHVGKVAVCTLKVARTSDNATAVMWRRCYIPLSD